MKLDKDTPLEDIAKNLRRAALQGSSVAARYVQICDECRMTGDFCGYHGLGREEISLCCACAEQGIDVWTITLSDCESGGVTAPSLKEAIDTVTAIVGEMDHEDGYTINKTQMSRLKVVTMPEFQGF